LTGTVDLPFAPGELASPDAKFRRLAHRANPHFSFFLADRRSAAVGKEETKKY